MAFTFLNAWLRVHLSWKNSTGAGSDAFYTSSRRNSSLFAIKQKQRWSTGAVGDNQCVSLLYSQWRHHFFPLICLPSASIKYISAHFIILLSWRIISQPHYLGTQTNRKQMLCLFEFLMSVCLSVSASHPQTFEIKIKRWEGAGGSLIDVAAQGSINIWDNRFKGGGIYDCLLQAVGDYREDCA